MYNTTYGYFNSKFRMLACPNEDNATSAQTENTASAVHGAGSQ